MELIFCKLKKAQKICILFFASLKSSKNMHFIFKKLKKHGFHFFFFFFASLKNFKKHEFHFLNVSPEVDKCLFFQYQMRLATKILFSVEVQT